jgi:hypothetical protein
MVALSSPTRADRAVRIKQTYSILGVAQRLGLQLKQRGQEWTCRCPFHEEKSASFSINMQKNICKCFGSCQLSFSVIDLVVKLLNVGLDEAMDWIEGQSALPTRQSVPAAPPAPKPFAYAQDRETLLGWKRNLLTRPGEMAWLDKRGVCDWSIHKYWIGFTTQVPNLMRGRLLTIPNYGYGTDGKAQFVGLEVRNLDYTPLGSAPKYKTLGTQTLYNLPILHHYKHPVVFLVETKFDAICINTALGRYCATALPAAAFNEQHARMLAPFRRIVVIRDPGEAGARFAAAVGAHLRNTEVLSLGECDLGEAYINDPDHVTDFLLGIYPWKAA